MLTARSSPLAMIRQAARNFKNETSIGAERWTFNEIILMSDAVLATLGELLTDIRGSAVPPLQMLTNIMEMLPNNCGGTRTVATAATLYRLLMELDKEEVKLFEKQNAFENDSATKGASAVHAAEERALAAELSRLEGFFSLMLLWDLQNFFDSIDVKTLFAEAAEVGFPLLQLALSMLVHQAPRRLKLGTAIGEPILELGRSILAGCSRSTDVARVYTLRMVKTLACCHPLVKIYQHEMT